MSQLDFQKAKDAEVAFINAQIAIRESQPDARRLSMDDEPMEGCFFLEIYSRIINLFLFFCLVNSNWRWRNASPDFGTQ